MHDCASIFDIAKGIALFPRFSHGASHSYTSPFN